MPPPGKTPAANAVRNSSPPAASPNSLTRSISTWSPTSQRQWNTKISRANFINPPELAMGADIKAGGRERHGALQMMNAA
ncbi:MAG: hypothetical protein ACK5NQ_03800 [Pseudomonas sp.]